MPSLEQTLLIAGAAEGSYFGTTDVRYKPSYANSKSGLSFGIFQFDVSANTEARELFPEIMKQAAGAQIVDRLIADEITLKAKKPNTGNTFTQAEKEIVAKALDLLSVREMIDKKTNEYAQEKIAQYTEMTNKATLVWQAKKAKEPELKCDMAILTEGSKEHLHLFAYLLANLNRYPNNANVFQNWMDGKNTKTATGPAAGFELKCPPTLDEMHTFFNSLRIWDGTQGNYKYLRDRLDPVLAKIGG